MSKDAVIAGLLALPDTEQREVLELLNSRLTPEELTLSPAQIAELDTRLDRIKREGWSGRPWNEIYDELMAKRSNAHR